MARNLSSNGPAMGDNSGAIDPETLRKYVGRGLSLRQMQKDLADDLKELCGEADEAGVCSKKELRRLIRMASMDQDIFDAQREREDMLLHALGDFASLPLGAAAIERAQKPKRGPGRPRKNRAEEAVSRAQAHLDDGGDFDDPEARMDADLDRIIGDPAGVA